MNVSLLPLGVLVDVTQNYGAAFYSCAAGMGLGAICLALVGPTKSGMCQSRTTIAEEEEKMPRDSDQPEFLEVDLAPEDGDLDRAMSQGSAPVRSQLGT